MEIAGYSIWWYVGFGVAAVLAVGGIVYGVITHKRRMDALDVLGMDQIRLWSKKWTPLTLVVDNNLLTFEDTIMRAVKEAAKAWNTAVGVELFVSPEDAKTVGHVIPIMEAPADSTEHEHALAYTRYALDKNGALARAAVYMQPGWSVYSRDLLARVMTHELGHCLGLGHDGMRNSVMYSAAVPEAFEITGKDVMFLKSTYG